MNETDLSERDGRIVCEQPPGELHGAGCLQRYAVCIGNGQPNQHMGGVVGTLNCMHDQQAVVYPGAQITCPTDRSNPNVGETTPTPTVKSKDDLVVKTETSKRKYIVRRLTPLECVRLQGYPDDYLDGVEGSDSAKYKALGNSLAIPCAYDVMNRIARFVENEKEGI